MRTVRCSSFWRKTVGSVGWGQVLEESPRKKHMAMEVCPAVEVTRVVTGVVMGMAREAELLPCRGQPYWFVSLGDSQESRS